MGLMAFAWVPSPKNSLAPDASRPFKRQKESIALAKRDSRISALSRWEWLSLSTSVNLNRGDHERAGYPGGTERPLILKA